MCLRGATVGIERTYFCDAPDCDVHGASATPPPYIPWGFIETRQCHPGGSEERHYFCSWDCAMKFAAAEPLAERHQIEGPDELNWRGD